MIGVRPFMRLRVSLTGGFDPILLVHADDLVDTSNHIRHDCVVLHVLRSP